MSVNPEKQTLPANRRRVDLSDGSHVVIRPPGILFEERVFGQFPDLVAYHQERQRFAERQQSGEVAADATDEGRNTALEYRVAIELVCACSVTPKLVEGTPGNGERFVDELDPTDFWKLAAECNDLWRSTRQREAAEVAPFAKAEPA